MATKRTIGNKPKILNPLDDYYKMDHSRRGTAHIFNHIDDGIDRDRMRLTLRVLGFEVEIHEHFNYDMIRRKLKNISSLNHSDADCLVIVVITHGDVNTLQACDRSYVTDELWQPFKSDKCPSLAGKPKIFFIDACRGKAIDYGTEVEYDANTGKPLKYAQKIPVMADFLMVYSTQPGHLGFDTSVLGSWFMNALCKQLTERYLRQDLLTILTFVNRAVAFNYEGHNRTLPKYHATKQISSIVSSLTRVLHFNYSKITNG